MRGICHVSCTYILISLAMIFLLLKDHHIQHSEIFKNKPGPVLGRCNHLLVSPAMTLLFKVNKTQACAELLIPWSVLI